MRNIIQLALLAVTFFAAVLPAASNDDIDKKYLRAAKRYRFKISSEFEFPPGISGKKIPIQEQEAELERFFSALDNLGVKFVRKSGLERVIVCRDLTHNGLKCAGVTLDDCIYLNYGFKKKIVYHEMFHVLDEKYNDPVWSKLNHRDFRYLGVDYPHLPVKAARRKALREHYRKVKRNFDADFVSRYAQSKEREDRAETFACMVDEGPAFLQRVQKSTVLYNKMLYIIDMTGRSSLLGRDYWKMRLGRDFTGKKSSQKRR